jgi:hypothetical protein
MALSPRVDPHSIFLSTVHLKAVEKRSFIPNIHKILGAVSKYVDRSLTHADNTRNEI